MKQIILRLSNGQIAYARPFEGARLAYWITLADGTVLPNGANTDALAGVPPAPVDSILHGWPVTGATAKWAETEDEFLARMAQVTILQDGEKDARFRGAVVVANIPPEGVPADAVSWRYRKAWDWLTPEPKIDINVEKAKPIHRDYLRSLRAPKLAALDVEFTRALERGAPPSEIAAIVAQKQALRDAPADPKIEAATTLNELAAVIPGALKA